MMWVERLSAVHERSARPAVIDTTGVVTGADFIGRAVSAAELLAGLNARAGEPIPALLTTNADALAMLLGGAAANRPLAPIGPRLTDTELAAAVRRTGSPLLLAETRFAAAAQQVADKVGVAMVEVPALPVSTRPLRSHAGPTAIYLHTAGTTGVPKRVPLTEQVLDSRSRLLRDVIQLGPDDRYATGSPLHHIGGLGNVLVAMSTGAAVICTEKFTVDWWQMLKPLGATHCLLVPTMIEILLAQRLLDAVPLRTLIYGASPMSVETLQRVLDQFPDLDLVHLYGQTEGSPITCLSPEDHRRATREPRLLATVGRAVRGLRLRIEEADGEGVGEVHAAADHLCSPGADGWLRTGDLGALDDDGYLSLLGRRHDMVVRGGENVYPVEVENALIRHSGVAGVGVVGVPDARLGETLAAFVVPVDERHPPSEGDLRSFARATLAGFKVPQYWHFVTELPLNSAGKVLRGALRTAHEAAR